MSSPSNQIQRYCFALCISALISVYDNGLVNAVPTDVVNSTSSVSISSSSIWDNLPSFGAGRETPGPGVSGLVDPDVHNFVELISIARTPVGQGNRFLIRYRKHADDVRVLFQGHNTLPEIVPQQEGADGEWSITLNSPETDMMLFVIFERNSFENALSLILDNGESGPEFSNLPSYPVPSFNSDDSVYQPGNDVHITGEIPFVNGVTSDSVGGVNKGFSGVDLDTREFHTYYEQNSFFVLGEPTFESNRVHSWMTLKTSTHHMAGVLSIAVDVRHPGHLIYNAQIATSISVHPSTQEGILPPGYLAIQDYGYLPTSANGNELHTCQASTVCPISCTFIGSSISETHVQELKADGIFESINYQVTSVYFDLTQTAHWGFAAEENSGDENGITTFKCTAIDNTHGTIATKLIDVMATIPAKIDVTKSSLSVERDEFRPNLLTVTLTCVVRSRPVPGVSMYLGPVLGYTSPETFDPSCDHETTTTRTFQASPADLHRYRNGVLAGIFQAPYCEAYSENSFDRYSFTLPDVC